MGGNADRDRVEPGGGQLGHRTVIRFRHHQRQRPRPERFGSLDARASNARSGARRRVGDMGDQRVERRPPLGGEEAGDRGRIGGVRPEPVDRLGRKRDQPAGAQKNGRPLPRRPRRPVKSAFQGPYSQGQNSSNRLLAVIKPKAISRVLSRSVAQPGRALRSGRRGRRFESCHSDHSSKSRRFPEAWRTGRQRLGSAFLQRFSERVHGRFGRAGASAAAAWLYIRRPMVQCWTVGQ